MKQVLDYLGSTSCY